MNLKDLKGMLRTLLSSIQLIIKGDVGVAFLCALPCIKILRFLHFTYIVVPYNKKLKYMCPLDQSCDFNYITTVPLLMREEFTPKPKWIIVDAGANIGLFSLYCAQKVYPQGKVIAIEPERFNRTYLLYNVRLNKFSNVLVLDIALADFNGKGRLFIATGQSHSLINVHSQAHGGVHAFVEVECRTLDRLVSELGILKIDLLNLDVEGSAHLVLRGAREALKRRILRRIIIEIHNREEATRCVYELLNNDYWVFYIDGSIMALAKTTY